MEAIQRAQGMLLHLPISAQLVLTVAVLGLTYLCFFTGERPYPGFPVVTSDNKHLKGSASWFVDGHAVLSKGLRECPSCFQVLTGSGYKIVLPNRFADQLRSHRDLNFPEAFSQDFFVHYPGFEPFREGLKSETFIQDVVRVKLTQSLGLITDDLVEESNESIHEALGEDRDWQTRAVKEDILNIVARLSARVFLGKPVCRNEDWLRISKEYTVNSFMASRDLRAIHPLIRPFKYWTIPLCTLLRQQIREARRIIEPEVERRREAAEALIKAGQKPAKVADAIGWMVEIATAQGRKVDYVAAQLSLTNAAIHTTSETMTKCVIQLCETPEIVAPMREEIIRVLREGGWAKTALYRLKLMDSFLKEVQRIRGLSVTSMARMVKKPVTLSDGTVLPAGARIMVTDDGARDAANFRKPTEFDVARFLRMREEAGEENRHQFVTTTATHMGFGHGQHACPGRFFASNEIKTALCFMLLKYDFRFVPGERAPAEVRFENASSTPPNMRLQVRRRREEIDLLDPR